MTEMSSQASINHITWIHHSIHITEWAKVTVSVFHRWVCTAAWFPIHLYYNWWLLVMRRNYKCVLVQYCVPPVLLVLVKGSRLQKTFDKKKIWRNRACQQFSHYSQKHWCRVVCEAWPQQSRFIISNSTHLIKHISRHC